MSETSPTGVAFRQTKHGYDPADVHARLDELSRELSEARSRADTERRRADEAERAAETARAEARELERRTGLPGYETIAQRVQTVLESADSAAAELRARAEGDAEAHKRQAEDQAEQILAEARLEADATARRGRQEADEAMTAAQRRVDALRTEITQLEEQRDRVVDALGSLRDRLTHVAQDLAASTGSGDELPGPSGDPVGSRPGGEGAAAAEPRRDEPSGEDTTASRRTSTNPGRGGAGTRTPRGTSTPV